MIHLKDNRAVEVSVAVNLIVLVEVPQLMQRLEQQILAAVVVVLEIKAAQ